MRGWKSCCILINSHIMHLCATTGTASAFECHLCIWRNRYGYFLFHFWNNERSLSVKKPNALAWQNGPFARDSVIWSFWSYNFFTLLFLSFTDMSGWPSDLRGRSLTPCWKRRMCPMIITTYLFLLSSLLFPFSFFFFSGWSRCRWEAVFTAGSRGRRFLWHYLFHACWNWA